MAIYDKINLIDRLNLNDDCIIELGCGSRKRHTNAIGIDALDYSCVDIVGDIYDVLAQFPSNSVDRVYSYHFVEHVESVSRLIAELSRIVKAGGIVEFVAPHFSNPYFYSDPTHRNFFGLYTFGYFSASTPLTRKVPTYQADLWFRLECVNLNFKSSRPFYGRYIFKKIFGALFNSCNYMREMYEENFCYLFPCYEVRYTLKRINNKDV